MLPTDAASADDLLTTKEVADLLRVNPVTVTRWLHEGTLTGVKVGPRTFRFRRADVEAKLTPVAPEATA
jgi:excisionase family DNA binding protein